MKPEVRLSRALDEAQRHLDCLRREGPLLLARDQETARADGYPASTLGDGGGHGKGDHADPTHAAALAPPRVDMVHELATSLVSLVKGATDQLRDAVGKTHKAKNLASVDVRHSNGPVDCLACDRTIMCTTADPVRMGFCSACSDAWYRWKNTERAAGQEPDRAQFIRARRRRLSEEGDTCRAGHSCCHQAGPHEHFHQPSFCPACIALLTVEEVLP